MPQELAWEAGGKEKPHIGYGVRGIGGTMAMDIHPTHPVILRLWSLLPQGRKASPPVGIFPSRPALRSLTAYIITLGYTLHP